MNANATLGENVTLFKGCTTGVVETGSKKGNPTIEDNVTLYANSIVCGSVTVKRNSKIAAGAFVNFDVPEGSTIVGNPDVIHHAKVNNGKG